MKRAHKQSQVNGSDRDKQTRIHGENLQVRESELGLIVSNYLNTLVLIDIYHTEASDKRT